jgi:hypothetical protein
VLVPQHVCSQQCAPCSRFSLLAPAAPSFFTVSFPFHHAGLQHPRAAGCALEDVRPLFPPSFCMAQNAGMHSRAPPSLSPRRPRSPLPLRSSFFSSLKSNVLHAFDRSDEKVKAYQDLAVNLSIFAAAIFAIHKYGHKLAI